MKAKDVVPWVLYAGLVVAMAGGASWPNPNWLVVVAGLGFIGAGIVLKRKVERELAHEVGARRGASLRSGETEAEAPLTKLESSVRALALEAETGALLGVAERVDALHAELIKPVADGQDDFVRLHGFQAWAAVMAPLATAERMLYRAWSAASDGHRREAVSSVAQALPYVEEAARAMAAVNAKA